MGCGCERVGDGVDFDGSVRGAGCEEGGVGCEASGCDAAGVGVKESSEGDVVELGGWW